MIPRLVLAIGRDVGGQLIEGVASDDLAIDNGYQHDITSPPWVVKVIVNGD